MFEAAWQALWKHVWERLHVIKEHWSTFAVLAVMGAVVAIISTRYVDSIQISNLQTQVGSEQSRSAFLQDQLTAFQRNQAAAASSPPSQWRRLSDRERELLLSAFKRPDRKLDVLVIFAMADSEPRQYAAQFVDVARTAGVDVRPREVPLSLMADVGVMIGLTTYPKPSDRAEKLKMILDSAGIQSHYTLWGKVPDDTDVDFDLFIGPKPW
jgi:hypothetical protein